MENKYSYGFSPIAVQDIDNVLYYISNELANPSAARAMYNLIFDRIDFLIQFPFGCSDCSIYGIDDTHFRHIKIENYVLVYKIDDATKKIWFLRFLYSGRNINPNFLR